MCAGLRLRRRFSALRWADGKGAVRSGGAPVDRVDEVTWARTEVLPPWRAIMRARHPATFTGGAE
jgi:hypothetical protein